PAASPANGEQQAGVYRDGTYVAIGTSRHGPIEARVVVKDGRITSASVSRCGTRYPCSDVNPLIKQVLSRQSAPVDYVSGATDSSKAYNEAVKNALDQAS
ncbi:MAG: FMN-binding protein, partial [Chloroflexi bacterium]